MNASAFHKYNTKVRPASCCLETKKRRDVTLLYDVVCEFAARYDPRAVYALRANARDEIINSLREVLRSELNANISKVYRLNFRHHFESLTLGHKIGLLR